MTTFIRDKHQQKTCLVTGAAGFVGSHLSRRLLQEGHRVIGVDSFTDYYGRELKESNISDLRDNRDFRMIEKDVAAIETNWFGAEQVDWVFHQAAQAGVRASWGAEFAHYTHHNVLATQRLLEWARTAKPLKIIYASSSSVYGAVEKLPMHEDDLPRPLSPYGVTKLAAEHLCNLYFRNFALPTVSLRYFTVYGPGQRPDMAFNRFIRAALAGEKITLYGSGEQTRDFTFVDDIVTANLAAAAEPAATGQIYNLGGGSRISVNGVLALIEKLMGQKIRVEHHPVQAGDPPHTYADTGRAENDLGFKPRFSLEEGLTQMVKWLS